VNEETARQVDVIKPLLARIRELGEVRSRLDEAGYDPRAAHQVYELLASCLSSVVTIAVVGEFSAGKSTLVNTLLTAPVPETGEAPVPGEPETPLIHGTLPESTERCAALIDGLDEVATAALIARSSLGTPAARRIRHKTPAGSLARILRRRDELTLTSKASDRVVLGARRVNGVYRRDLDDELEAWSRELPGDDAGATDNAAVSILGCSEVLGRIYLCLDGDLEEDESAKVRQHLDECGSCLREYRLEEAVKRLVHKHCGSEHVPAELRVKVLNRIRTIAANSSLSDLRDSRAHDP
jgi:mycothiol system anti-sigma-R factor